MSRVENKEKYKEYAHNHYIKHKRPKTKIGQAELKIIKLEKDNEELIKRRDIVLLKLAEKTTQIVNLEAKLAQAKMNESFEKEKKDNAFKFIEELKQQLAEKKKEVETLQHYNDRLAQGIYHSYGEHFVSKIRQGKTSFCIEQLEKVLPSIKATIELAENRHQMKDQVDIIIYNQIEELKKENK